MNNYVTGKLIKELREKNRLTQIELGNIINVSDKTISKWETGKGLPDISLIEPLSKVLKVSLTEFVNGGIIRNNNSISNLIKSFIYVCPICGNIFHSVGEGVISCCGISLTKQIEEYGNNINIEEVENEYYISINHEMSKTHYISFIAYVTSDRFEIVKLYSEGEAATRFLKRGHGIIYAYCNKEGLMAKKI